jgi:long-subunit acyl-CoA synthetase (AMP-forming)
MAIQNLTDYLKESDENGVLVGEPHPNIQIKINELHSSNLLSKAEGQLGEILVAGPHVLHNYYRDLSAFSKNKIVEGETIWHKTGDAGYLKNGKLYYYGRVKHIWQQENRWLSPITLEKFLADNNFEAEATWQHIDGKNVLFVTPKMDLKLLLKHFPYKIDRVVKVRKLPKDKRHLSRIDYEVLAAKLNF